MSWWSRLAHWVLDHRTALIAAVVVISVVLGYEATQVQTDHAPGQFIDSDSKVRRDYDRASQVFGQSQATLYLVFDGADPYDPAFLQALDAFGQRVEGYKGVQNVLSLANVPYLVREGNRIAPVRLYDPDLPVDSLRTRIENQLFLRGLLLSNEGETTSMIVQIEGAFNDTAERVDLVERIAREADALPGGAALAGFPYLRTQYAERVTSEAPLFTALALLVSLVCLYFTFRSWRAVIVPTLIVGLGILWTIGLIGLFRHKLNIVTSILPALLVIIGMASAIHLCTKYFDQYRLRGDQREAMIHTIRTVGLSTFLACLTTAVGFGVLVLSGSKLLAVFGEFAAAGITILYVLSITLIPLVFVAARPPSDRGVALTASPRLARFLDRLSGFTQRRAPAILAATGLLIAVGVLGITRISTDIYVFSDFYEDDPLRQDLAVFERAYGGVLPMEVIVEANRPGQFRTLGALRRLEALEDTLEALPPVGRALSAPDLVKLANQAYFGGNPQTYRLPSSYELPFLQAALQDFLDQDRGSSLTQNLPKVVDSTFTMARVYLGVDDVGTTRMNTLADTVRARAEAAFPAEQYTVTVTGTAIVNTRSGENLVQNLLVSLAVALVLISVLMAVMFRSPRLVAISLLPNIIPLLVVGGAMGFGGIILKPSTALIFSIAFGIAVDNTIHFLAKYRLHRYAGLELEEAVRTTLRETGKAILFTSFVLMGGFLVFTLSSFGGTVNMGALTALTLGVAMVANLLLLPALLFRFGPRRADATVVLDEEPVG